MKVSLCLAALLLLTGCATTGRYRAKVQSWQGKSATALMKSWGQPDASEKLSNGDRMLVYSRLYHKPLAFGQLRPVQRSIASVPGHAPAEPAIYIECATYFEVNAQNVVVSSFFRGDECKSGD